MRMTRQRKVILEEIRKTTTHPTADELYQIVRRKLPRISLATVYRNLEQLAAEGLILKIETAGAQMRFDGQPRNHYHIRCVRCGAVEDAPIEPDPTLEQLVQKNSSYHIIGHTVQFLGICPGCKGAED